MTDQLTRLAVAAPLPPARSGVAAYVARQLPELSRRLEVILAVADPAAVDPSLAADHRIVGLDELGSLDVDAVLYHLGNSTECLEVARAIDEGPPGVVLAHDLSIHHLVSYVGLGLDHPDEYAAALETAFGDRGRRLAELRIAGERGEAELALFDLVGPLLRRHRAVVVHSTWAAGLVRRRAPGVPVAVVPHFAPEPVPPLDRIQLGLPLGDSLIGVLGNAVPAKRPDVVLGAVRRLVDRGRAVHVVVGGRDGTDGELAVLIDELGLGEHATVTGWLSDRDLRALAGTLDAVVALRSPHLGESSGPVPMTAVAGTPLVAWPVGSFADLPPDAYVAAPVGGDEVGDLADALDELLANPARAAVVGAKARRWALDELAVERCVDRLVGAVAAAPEDVPDEVEVDRPWGPLIGRRRPGRAVVTGGNDDDADALRAAGWLVRPVAGAPGMSEAPVGWADLVVWRVRSDEHIDRAALDGLHRGVHPAGRLVVRVPTERLSLVIAKALDSAGFGAGGLDQLEPVRLGGESVLTAVKVGAPR
ncbi:MAG: glycosyltransferase family 4 protein [Actinomycetota bacterium]